MFAGPTVRPRQRNWGCDPAPAQRMTRPLAHRVSDSRAVSVGQFGSRCGTLDTARPKPTCRARPAFVDRSYDPLLPALRRAFSGALSTGPNEDGVAGRFKSELLPSLTPCGPDNRCTKDTPFVRWRRPRRSPTLGVGASGT